MGRRRDRRTAPDSGGTDASGSARGGGAMLAPDEREGLITELVERFSFADRWGAVARTRELLAAGVDDGELRRVVGSAVHRVGLLWQDGSWTITQEHAATAVAEAVLGVIEIAVEPPPPCGTVAVVAADGEWHALPARLAAHAFESAGMRVQYLGAGVPAPDVAATLPGAGVDVLAVSVTVPGNLLGAARTVAAGRAAGVPVLLGGAASTPSRAAAVGAGAHADDVDEGAAIARRWCEEGAPPHPTPTVDTAAATRLTLLRSRVLDAAYEAMAGRWAPLDDPDEALIDHTVDDLGLHLDHLAAAVLLGEPATYVDLVGWFADVHRGRGAPPDALVAQLDGLAAALADQPALAELLATARASAPR